MEFVIPLLGLIGVIVVATVLNKKFPRVPLALFQILLGAMVSWLPFIPLTLEFEPEVFMVCLIAPLLFSDARVTSRKELWVYRKPILFMALGLVLITVIGLGYAIHILIPSMPLAAAFALAAVLSPTDAVAVKSITQGLPLPSSLMPILEGESLLNDAAGIVSFKVALAVVLSGVFSVQAATFNFLIVSIGGILAGLICGFLFVKLRLSLRQNGFEEVNSLVAIQFITPFVIFIIAEELAVSGILAVVAAGIIHGIERDRLQQTSTKIQITSSTTWSVLSYLFNGFVFVLLGFLLPEVVHGLLTSQEISIMVVLGFTLLISVGLFLIRYIWVYVLHRNFAAIEGHEPHGEADNVSRGRYAFLTATCGIHGTITLATAMSIPYELSNGTLFPYRNTILFISAGVILLSLIFATVVLPLTLRHATHHVKDEKSLLSIQEATQLILQRTIQLLHAESDQGHKRATFRVIRELEEQRRMMEEGKASRLSSSVLRKLQEIAREAEMKKLTEMIEQGEVSSQLMMHYPVISEPQELYTVRSNLRRIWFGYKMYWMKKKLKKLSAAQLPPKLASRTKKMTEFVEELHRVKGGLRQAAIQAIQQHMTPDNRYEAMFMIQYYARLQQATLSEEEEANFMEKVSEVRLLSIQLKRDLVQKLEESEQITPATRLKLLQNMNYEEMLLLDPA
ncbi:Na+/H+ antiporter [Paenibacillus sp. GCM10027629]|uniref:Na+/H+ antiporter n=1 Tax=Paenibacillus sp. GCM10027629 TaxID=3273414 RepID=UPI0036329CB7